MKVSPACFVFSILLLLTSCARPVCDCDYTPVKFVDVKLVDQQGQNLVFGPARFYSADTIKVLQSDGSLGVHNASVNRSSADTAALRFDFYVQAMQSFIYYGQQIKPDTLNLVWVEKTGNCCGRSTAYVTIDSVKWNGRYIQPQTGIYTIVK